MSRLAGRALVVSLLLMLVSGVAGAADKGTEAEAEFSRKGADTCLGCHDESSKVPVAAIFKTPHGSQTDPRAPFSQEQCEACHGPSASHTQRYRDEADRPPPMAFGPHSSLSAEEQNGFCLSCHTDHRRMEWDSSPHADAELLCSSCHQIHTLHDRVSSPEEQNEVCGSCHGDVIAATMSTSSHPIRQGQMSCSDCHQAHGNRMGDFLLKRGRSRDTCLGCHAEKRGPYLWEHAPASEDCSLCHQAHGSNHPSLLNSMRPLLCQSCHSQDGHVSEAFTPDGLASGQPSGFLLLNSCTNCHSQVHGSNHPSGSKLLR